MNKQTALGMSIAGFVILILSVFIPFYGLHVGGIALALATIGAFLGERIFAIVTVTVSAAKVWFLSPTFNLIMSNATGSDLALFYAIAIGAHAAPIIALLLAANRTKPSEPEDTPKTTGMPRGK